jgi:hypothetical protein
MRRVGCTCISYVSVDGTCPSEEGFKRIFIDQNQSFRSGVGTASFTRERIVHDAFIMAGTRTFVFLFCFVFVNTTTNKQQVSFSRLNLRSVLYECIQYPSPRPDFLSEREGDRERQGPNRSTEEGPFTLFFIKKTNETTNLTV